MIVRKAASSETGSDAKAIHKIAKQLERSASHPNGFLVSGYEFENYKEFIRDSEAVSKAKCVVLVCEHLEDIVGFLIAYNSVYIKKIGLNIKETSEARILNKFGDDIDFFVVKQIGVSDVAAGKGVASFLYDFFAHQVLTFRPKPTFGNEYIFKFWDVRHWFKSPNPDRLKFSHEIVDIFTSVVVRPYNLPSFAFHEKLGHETVSVWSSMPRIDKK